MIQKIGLIPAIALLIIACGDDSSSSNNQEKLSDADVEVDSYRGLSTCNGKHEGETAYVVDQDQAYICKDGKWVEDDDAVEIKSSSSSTKSSSSSEKDDQESSSSSVSDLEEDLSSSNVASSSSESIVSSSSMSFGIVTRSSSSMLETPSSSSELLVLEEPIGTCVPSLETARINESVKWGFSFKKEITKILPAMTLVRASYEWILEGEEGFAHVTTQGKKDVTVAYSKSGVKTASVSIEFPGYEKQVIVCPEVNVTGEEFVNDGDTSDVIRLSFSSSSIRDEELSSSSDTPSSSSEIPDPVDPSTVTTGTMTDSRDGQTYKTVTIGKQTWMAENLNYEMENSSCYDNVADNCTKSGRLYTWDAATTACPSGWHLPAESEWMELIYSVGGEASAGKMLKSTSGWKGDGARIVDNAPFDCKKPNGVDAYSFTVLPTDEDGWEASFWSSTESYSEEIGFNAVFTVIFAGSSDNSSDCCREGVALFRLFGEHSIRCVKD